jgi:hypothetical protein
MVYNTTKHPQPQPSHTLSVNTVRLLWEGEEVRDKVEGQQFSRRVENINMTDCIPAYNLY